MAIKTVAISLPEGLLGYIDGEARRKFQSRSEYIRELIRDEIERQHELEQFLKDTAAEQQKGL